MSKFFIFSAIYFVWSVAQTAHETKNINISVVSWSHVLSSGQSNTNQVSHEQMYATAHQTQYDCMYANQAVIDFQGALSQFFLSHIYSLIRKI